MVFPSDVSGRSAYVHTTSLL